MKHDQIQKEDVAFLFGRIDNQLETAAAGMGVAKGELTIRVAEALLGSQVRGIYRPSEYMSDLSHEAGTGSPSSRKEKVVLRSPSSTSGGPGSYWSKLTPEQRRREMKRRYRKGLRNKKKSDAS